MYRYKATKLIVETFESRDVKFMVDSNFGQEEIRAGFSIDGGPRVIVSFFSKDDDNDVAVRILGLISKVPDEKRIRVLEVCNILNRKLRHMKFDMDFDNDVNLEYDFPLSSGDENLGEMAFELFVRVMHALNTEYDLFMKAMYTDEKLMDDQFDREIREAMIKKLEEMKAMGDIPESAEIKFSSVIDPDKTPQPFEDFE